VRTIRQKEGIQQVKAKLVQSVNKTREGKLLHGQYIKSVDRQLVGGEGKVLHGSTLEVWVESLLVERAKCCMASTLEVWIDSLLVENTRWYGC